MPTSSKQADQMYTLADVSRLLKVGPDRLRALVLQDEMLGPDLLVPGGGHKAQRWSASRVAEIQKSWAMPAGV